MIRLLAFSSFRSLYDVVLPLDQLNVVVGGNGVGKKIRVGHVRAWGVPIGRGLLGQWQDVVVCTVVCDVVCVG